MSCHRASTSAFLVLHGAQVASVCQILDVLPQASEDASVVVVVALLYVGFGFGILVIGKSFLGVFVRVTNSLGANSTFELLIHIEAEDIVSITADCMNYEMVCICIMETALPLG